LAACCPGVWVDKLGFLAFIFNTLPQTDGSNFHQFVKTVGEPFYFVREEKSLGFQTVPQA
jgi:hypothetical protein